MSASGILLPFVQVGITDRVSVGGGTPLVFASDSSHPVWFTPKVQVYRGRNVQAAVGVMHFLNLEDDGGLGIAYGVTTTIGSDDSAVSDRRWMGLHQDADSNNARSA